MKSSSMVLGKTGNLSLKQLDSHVPMLLTSESKGAVKFYRWKSSNRTFNFFI